MFPDDLARKILSEYLAMWLAVEKCAFRKFSISDKHWIQEKI